VIATRSYDETWIWNHHDHALIFCSWLHLTITLYLVLLIEVGRKMGTRWRCGQVSCGWHPLTPSSGHSSKRELLMSDRPENEKWFGDKSKIRDSVAHLAPQLGPYHRGNIAHHEATEEKTTVSNLKKKKSPGVFRGGRHSGPLQESMPSDTLRASQPHYDRQWWNIQWAGNWDC
jgi:hypothetical protein